VRRGLNTTSDQEADTLVAELNTLLSDRAWWSADRRADAERLFKPQIVSAFFDGIEVGPSESAQLRERHIALPSREEGYTHVLMAGTTGAGKAKQLRAAQRVRRGVAGRDSRGRRTDPAGISQLPTSRCVYRRGEEIENDGFRNSIELHPGESNHRSDQLRR
jgi:hypothetical protein